jgi:hypothetical protein
MQSFSVIKQIVAAACCIPSAYICCQDGTPTELIRRASTSGHLTVVTIQSYSFHPEDRRSMSFPDSGLSPNYMALQPTWPYVSSAYLRTYVVLVPCAFLFIA